MPQESSAEMLAEVEDYKIPKELKELVKTYRNLEKLSSALRVGLGAEKLKTQQLQRMLYQTDQVRDRVLGRIKPEEKVIQQPKPSPDFRINY